MAIQLKHRSPTGETRPWTIKEIIQGKPINRPTHPMLIHFPIAFYIGALALDVMSRVATFPAAPLAATWAILGAFIATVGAVTTGLADWTTLRPGSRARSLANRHLVLQLIVASMFVAVLALRWGDRHQPEADVLWIVLETIAVGILIVAADFGGQLVFWIGMRVGSEEN
jgi:uncharacterized membrane protein